MWTEVFSVPTKSFLSYESRVWLPYVVKRYVLRKNVPTPQPVIEKAEAPNV